MIKKVFYGVREDGVSLYRTYSTKNNYIQKFGTDEIYSEAIDVESANYEYVETSVKIEEEKVEESV